MQRVLHIPKRAYLLISPTCRSSFVYKIFFVWFLSHNWLKNCDDTIFMLWIHMYYNFLFQTVARLKEVNARWHRDYSEYSSCEKNPAKVFHHHHHHHYWYGRPILFRVLSMFRAVIEQKYFYWVWYPYENSMANKNESNESCSRVQESRHLSDIFMVWKKEVLSHITLKLCFRTCL